MELYVIKVDAVGGKSMQLISNIRPGDEFVIESKNGIQVVIQQEQGIDDKVWCARYCNLDMRLCDQNIWDDDLATFIDSLGGIEETWFLFTKEGRPVELEQGWDDEVNEVIWMVRGDV